MKTKAKLSLVAAALLAGALVAVVLSSELSTPSQIAARDRTVGFVSELFSDSSPKEGCMRTKVDSSIVPINESPWLAGAFKVKVREYELGVMAGSYGACPIKVRGMGGDMSEAISSGHYWFAGEDLESNTKDLARESLFVQYYSASYNAFRYDEIFVYDAEYDTKVSGIEMFEVSNMVDGYFGNINMSPGIHNMKMDPNYGGTVKGTGAGACIARGGNVMPSARDLVNTDVGTYLGVVKFPKGFMLTGELFDAYSVKDRWPVPGAVIIMYVDRTSGSPNYGLCTAWVIFQNDGDKAGKNYWWDFSKNLKGGDKALDKFNFDPDYYFKLPKPLVDACDNPGSTIVLPIPPLGNMTKSWLPGGYGEPGWALPDLKAKKPSPKKQ